VETDWFALIVSGALGAFVAAFLGLLVWLSRIPGQLDEHDRAARELDEDLATWLADRHVKLKRELRTVDSGLAARNAFHSGERGCQSGLTKESALHEYRDEERKAKRTLDALRDRETWLHRLVRWCSRSRPELELLTPVKAVPLLDVWRLPASRHLTPTDTPAPVDDPTARTLEGALADVENDVSRFL
jgi:hypothetical protein